MDYADCGALRPRGTFIRSQNGIISGVIHVAAFSRVAEKAPRTTISFGSPIQN